MLGQRKNVGSAIPTESFELESVNSPWDYYHSIHCLYCHGYEQSGCDSVGVIASFGPLAKVELATQVAQLALQFAREVVVYTNGSVELAQQVRNTVNSNPHIVVDSRPIESLVNGSEANGEPAIKLSKSTDEGSVAGTVSHRFFVHVPNTRPNLDFARSLGLDLSDTGSEIKVIPPFNATNLPGCFAVGDVATPFKTILSALATGSVTAAGITTHLAKRF